MNVFIGLSALLTLLVVAWLVRPLLRKPGENGISSEKLNAAIHRDQLHALEADLARGVISQQDFETTRDELQLRLLDDTESFEASPKNKKLGFWTAKRTAVAVGLSLPILAMGIYLQLGTPAAIDPVATANNNDHQMQEMIDKLAARLKTNPNDSKGWVMLARSYKAIGRFEDAQQAYVKAGDIANKDPDLLVDRAELTAILAGNQLAGKPEQMIQEALRLNPEHPMGLMLAGMAAYQNADYKTAVTRWEKLLDMIPPAHRMRSKFRPILTMRAAKAAWQQVKATSSRPSPQALQPA